MAGDFRERTEKVTARTTIRPTGLDVFTQESGLATRTGKLTKAGRTYLQHPGPGRSCWRRSKNGRPAESSMNCTASLSWAVSNHAERSLTPPESRREKVIEALSWCPVGQWIAIGDFYRADSHLGFRF